MSQPFVPIGHLGPFILTYTFWEHSIFCDMYVSVYSNNSLMEYDRFMDNNMLFDEVVNLQI